MATKVEITLNNSPLDALLLIDPDRLMQTLTNLLSNAIKFSEPNSTVWLSAELVENCHEVISQGSVVTNGSPTSATTSLSTSRLCQKTESHILIQVRDQGRGIPQKNLESIFERFHQVDASDSRQKGGTGLGLAICRSIIQQHGGEIWVESELGKGSTFFLALPMKQDAQKKM